MRIIYYFLSFDSKAYNIVEMTHSVLLLSVVDYNYRDSGWHPALHKSKSENAHKAF